MAGIGIEKNTIPIGVFHQALTKADLPHKSPPKGVQVIAQLHLPRHGFDFPIVYPDEATGWATAAVPALGALKGQPRSIPGKLGL